jgi:hypothetical protein
VAADVGERLLHDAVGGQLDAGIQRGDAPADDQARARSRRVARLVDQGEELLETGLRRPRRLRSGVLAQHAEQPAHLRERRARGVADGQQALGALRRHPGCRDTRRLGLHRDHRDVVRDDVVQLTRDPGPLAARGQLEQRALDRLALGGAGARPARLRVRDDDPGGERGRDAGDGRQPERQHGERRRRRQSGGRRERAAAHERERQRRAQREQERDGDDVARPQRGLDRRERGECDACRQRPLLHRTPLSLTGGPLASPARGTSKMAPARDDKAPRRP